MARYGRAASKAVRSAMRRRKAGTLRERQEPEKSEEPQAGDRHRSLRSAPQRRQGPAQAEAVAVRPHPRAELASASSNVLLHPGVEVAHGWMWSAIWRAWSPSEPRN